MKSTPARAAGAAAGAGERGGGAAAGGGRGHGVARRGAAGAVRPRARQLLPGAPRCRGGAGRPMPCLPHIGRAPAAAPQEVCGCCALPGWCTATGSPQPADPHNWRLCVLVVPRCATSEGAVSAPLADATKVLCKQAGQHAAHWQNTYLPMRRSWPPRPGSWSAGRPRRRPRRRPRLRLPRLARGRRATALAQLRRRPVRLRLRDSPVAVGG